MARAPSRTGRPTRIDAVVAEVDRDGRAVPVTVAERIVALLDAGNYLETACAATGVNKDTVYGWLRTAAQAQLDLHARPPKLRRRDLTAMQRKCMAFSDAVMQAEARWEAATVTTLERLGRGGTVLEHTTEKRDGKNHVVERTVKRETLAPNHQVLEWRLSRRFPERYSTRVEVTGEGGGPVEVELSVRDELLADLRRVASHRELELPAAPGDGDGVIDLD